jgi:hypothetical protein
VHQVSNLADWLQPPLNMVMAVIGSNLLLLKEEVIMAGDDRENSLSFRFTGVVCVRRHVFIASFDFAGWFGIFLLLPSFLPVRSPLMSMLLSSLLRNSLS